MFRETTTDTQMSLFDNPADLMGKRAVKKYEDPKAWFNQFYELVTSQVDESIFKPLFKEGNMGAPTASIRQLVAMNILKEGFGCSDEDLIEKCDYDLLTRRALVKTMTKTLEPQKLHFADPVFRPAMVAAGLKY